MSTMTAESDDDVHLSPSSVSSAGGGGGGGGGGIRFKILCSFGGRIMPRPSDGALKYIGGETRVLAVPRSIPFRDLKKKVEEMFKTDVAAIKYQLLSSDDLDILVSITCDEDLVHMLDEYDRFESKRSPSASPRFRVYVFVPHQAISVSSAAAVAAAVSASRHAPTYARSQQQHYQHHQQHFQPERYVASVPGTPAGSPPYPDQPNGVASAGNSPRANIVEPPVFRGGMQRVRSSPNLGGLNAAPQPFSQHAGDGGSGSLAGYMSTSPGQAGAGHLFLQGNSYSQYRNPQPQYSPAPVPVPHHASAAGRHDMRGAGGYARGGSFVAAPMVPALRSGRPVSRGGGPTYSEMQTQKKAATIWD